MNSYEYVAREICLGDALDEAALKWPDRIGWVFDDVRVSFAEMKRRTDEVARGLLALGTRSGDAVALWMPNRAEFAYCEFACAKIGAIVVALNTRFKTFELEHILRHSGARVLVMVEQFLKHDFVASLESLFGEWEKSPDGTVTFHDFPRLDRLVSLAPTPQYGFLPWNRLIESSDTVDPKRLDECQREQQWSNSLILQYTSGTTALPKGALCNHRYVLNFGVEFTLRTGLQPGEPFLNTQPFYHNGGSCGAIPLPLTLGGAVVSAGHYEPDRILALIEREGCVSRSGYGAMYIMEMNHPRFREYDLSSLRGGWCVGNASLMQRVRDAFDMPDLIQIYGATEGGSTSGHFEQPWEVRANSCGYPLTGSEIAIYDPATDQCLPRGEVGEIRINGWCRMSVYFKQPEETARTIDSEGWVHTGDLGVFDENGNLHFVGRLKDMLKIGGENVSAEEVEAVLLQHPDIKQAAVIGAPDDRLSEVVMAVVERRPGVGLEEEDVIGFCRGRVANFRVPRYVRFVEEWPMTGSGKIQKHALRTRFLAEQDNGAA